MMIIDRVINQGKATSIESEINFKEGTNFIVVVDDFISW